MHTNNYPVHRTFTNRIPDSEGGGWEFWCVECSYRVRYTNADPLTDQQLQVLDAGDLQARHTSNQAGEEQLLDEPFSGVQTDAVDIPPDELNPLEGGFVEEKWLTPDIRAFLERLAGRLDP